MKWLQSRRFALGLLIGLSTMCLFSIVAPQRGLFEEAEYVRFERENPVYAKVLSFFSLDDVFNSSIFLLLCLGTALALLVYVGRRAARLLFGDYFKLTGPENAAERREGRDALRRSIPWARALGSTFFHAGLLAVILGAAAGRLFGFQATVALTESQTFVDRHESYAAPAEGPLFLERHGFFRATLQSVERYFQNGVLTDLRAAVQFEDEGRTTRAETRINYPLRYKGAELVVKKNGHAPHFRLRSRDGVDAFAAYVNINHGSCGDEHFLIPARGLKVFTEFYPRPKLQGDDRGQRQGAFDSSRSTLNVRVEKASSDGGGSVVLYQGPLKMGEFVPLEGLEFGYDGVRSWILFGVSRDPGKPIVFAGFWIALAGLLARFSTEEWRVEDRSRKKALRAGLSRRGDRAGEAAMAALEGPSFGKRVEGPGEIRPTGPPARV